MMEQSENTHLIITGTQKCENSVTVQIYRHFMNCRFSATICLAGGLVQQVDPLLTTMEEERIMSFRMFNSSSIAITSNSHQQVASSYLASYQPACRNPEG